MTKMRVHELAKELGVDNKDLMEALKKKDVEVKSHMSSLEDNVVADLKKEFGKSAGAEKAGEKKEEAPKKKTIMQVFRPQNAKNSGRGSSNRPAGARQGAGRGGVRPTGAAGNSARLAAASAGNGARPAGASAGNTARPAGTAAQTARPARPQEKSRADKQQSGSRREPWTERSTLTGEQKSGKPSAGSGNPRRGVNVETTAEATVTTTGTRIVTMTAIMIVIMIEAGKEEETRVETVIRTMVRAEETETVIRMTDREEEARMVREVPVSQEATGAIPSTSETVRRDVRADDATIAIPFRRQW